MEEAVLKLKLEHPEWGRRKIANELGIGEKRVRTILSKHKGEIGEAGIKSVKYSNGETVIQAVIHLNDLNDQNAIMRACNYDPNAWECISSEVKAYQSLIKDSESKPVVTDLYSVTVKVKPKKNDFDLEACLEKINRMEPVEILPHRVSGTGLLEVGITDAHFGANTFDDYQETLAEVLGLIDDADEVLLILGSDNLHTNNFQNTTVKGTVLEEIDFEKAFDDAFKFFGAIIYRALSQSKRMHVKYLRGNHDETASFLLCKTLQAVYQAAEYDLSMEQYKVHRYHDVCIGLTHGDNGQAKNYDRLFRAQFPEMGTAKVIELHAGHLHREMVSDVYGTMVRTLPTGTERTGWTKDKGYHSVRRFQCFLYGEDSLKAIYYV